MKFGVITLFFNAERTILRCIENYGPHVDNIYISYSELPWSVYNTQARTTYRNKSDINLLKKSAYYHKIKIITGVWETDEDQRNEVVKQAKADGMDYLIVQDADEFYLPEEFQKNIGQIESNPNYPYYYTPWINFWKNLDYILVVRGNIIGSRSSIYSICPNFAINLKYADDIHFELTRQPNYPPSKAYALSGLCYHLSYVYTDEDVKVKTETWGHSHLVQDKWYKYKWLGWTPASRFINPMMGPVWQRAIKFDGQLPNELLDFPAISHAYVPLSRSEKVDEFIYDMDQLRLYTIHYLKAGIARILKIGQYKDRSK